MGTRREGKTQDHNTPANPHLSMGAYLPLSSFQRIEVDDMMCRQDLTGAVCLGPIPRSGRRSPSLSVDIPGMNSMPRDTVEWERRACSWDTASNWCDSGIA